ncbi:hypothetical protein [Streptomyces tsukubensis]|uniref:Integral membrane protein n=1 Tax=Streptomyces tsukubensis TaxID=83656 RepID=A0A1V4A5Y4_9ACTN|nr:hypothetical protein [Streptomyces tsukubensis]OON76187.1 hypothetical protein B1H18_21425 [Streptomyces tsukubensis]QFR93711.1 hypothetical protein GBW32_12245 [Streptomyces tsukubensis]
MAASTQKRQCHRDLWAVAAAAALFALAAVVGTFLNRDGGKLRLHWPPLYADWMPHVGPGTVAAPAVAVLVVGYGPSLARRLPWRALVPTVWAAALAWTVSLALVDGWSRGITRRLTTAMEYLQSVGDVHSVHATLRGFTDHILVGSPDIWPAHVSGHPPAALLTFVLLDRVGLGGGTWAAVWCLVVGTSFAAAVMVTLRPLCGEDVARRAAPFLALAPAAVWIGVSADGYFAGVAAWSIALLAVSAARTTRVPRLAAVGSGLLLGLTFYLSYGLVVFVVLAAAVLVIARTGRPVPWVVLGIVPWVIAFTAAGFWWLDGYRTLHERYYQGAAKIRPFSYFIWANLAAQVVSLGPAAVAGLRRTASPLWRTVRSARAVAPAGYGALALLIAAAFGMRLLADISGMSKAETERIWLPFTVWLFAACALLPRGSHRWWLSGQAAVALVVNHLFFTGW